MPPTCSSNISTYLAARDGSSAPSNAASHSRSKSWYFSAFFKAQSLEPRLPGTQQLMRYLEKMKRPVCRGLDFALSDITNRSQEFRTGLWMLIISSFQTEGEYVVYTRGGSYLEAASGIRSVSEQIPLAGSSASFRAPCWPAGSCTRPAKSRPWSAKASRAPRTIWRATRRTRHVRHTSWSRKRRNRHTRTCVLKIGPQNNHSTSRSVITPDCGQKE